MAKIAVVQEAPVFLDRKQTIDKAVKFIAEAAANGAGLVIFTEAFIPGYPAWIWRLRPGSDWGLSEDIHARLLDTENARQQEAMGTLGVNLLYAAYHLHDDPRAEDLLDFAAAHTLAKM